MVPIIPSSAGVLIATFLQELVGTSLNRGSWDGCTSSDIHVRGVLSLLSVAIECQVLECHGEEPGQEPVVEPVL